MNSELSLARSMPSRPIFRQHRTRRLLSKLRFKTAKKSLLEPRVSLMDSVVKKQDGRLSPRGCPSYTRT